jgi:hypothetical protein
MLAPRAQATRPTFDTSCARWSLLDKSSNTTHVSVASATSDTDRRGVTLRREVRIMKTNIQAQERENRGTRKIFLLYQRAASNNACMESRIFN